MTKDIYVFSGLGADERVFKLLDFSNHNSTFIKWIPPKKNETIENYALRITSQIKTEKPVLIGLSFGGIVAIEVAKLIKVEKIILIASVKTKDEIPFYYQAIGKIRFHHLIPYWLLKQSNLITNWFFGAKSKSDKKILKEVLLDTDTVFLKWAIDKIVNWENEINTNTVYHIHGSEDKILPIRFINCDETIHQGGHLMTLNKAEELNQLLFKSI